MVANSPAESLISAPLAVLDVFQLDSVSYKSSILISFIVFVTLILTSYSSQVIVALTTLRAIGPYKVYSANPVDEL